MTNLQLLELVSIKFKEIINLNKTNVLYLLYYSALEAILLLVLPLTSAFIINTVLAHATISIYTLSTIIIVVFFMIAVLKVLKSLMVEKFEQQIFVSNAIEISQLAIDNRSRGKDKNLDKYMNYFFDVIAIQKLFPTLLLSGSALVIKIIITLIILFIIDISLFVISVFFIISFIITMIFLGKRGPKLSIERSDAKHTAIYYIQDIPSLESSEEEIYVELDALLINFANKRDKIFKVIIRQLGLSYFSEGIILSTFFIWGAYLVFKGVMPIGEFIAAEIIIISVIYTMQDFVKQIDYIYDSIEGFYKINKLSIALDNDSHV